MTRLVRATELMGLPVVTLDKAAAVGEVRDVFFDPSTFASCGADRARPRAFSPALLGLLPTGSVRSIGRDAVMIDTADSLLGHREGCRPPSTIRSK